MGSDGIHPHPIQWLGCGTLLELIDKAEQGNPSVSNDDLYYNGSEQSLGDVKAGDGGTTVTYSLSEDGNYTEDTPTATDVGEYTVYYVIIGDTNHKDYIGNYNARIIANETTIQNLKSFDTISKKKATYTKFQRLASSPEQSVLNSATQIQEEGDIPVYAWVDDDNILNVYSTADTIYFPQDSSEMFSSWDSITDIDLSGFNTSKVSNMSYMFYSCPNIKAINLSNTDTSNVTNMSWMFNGCSILSKLNLIGFNTSKVTNMSFMFNCCPCITSLDLSSFNTSNVNDMMAMFYGCNSLRKIYVSDIFVTDKVTSGYTMFNNDSYLTGGLGTRYNESHTDFEYARIDDPNNGKPGYFRKYTTATIKKDALNTAGKNKKECIYRASYKKPSDDLLASATRVDDESCSDVPIYAYVDDEEDSRALAIYTEADKIYLPEDSSYIFSGWKSYEVDLELFDSSKVTNMEGMFSYSDIDEVDLRYLDTRNVTNMKDMFRGCSKLEEVNLNDLNSTSEVTNMQSMFASCGSLRSVDIDKCDLSNVETMTYMFSGDSKMDFFRFPTHEDNSKLEDATYMFGGCSDILDVEFHDFDFSHLIKSDAMFYGCSNLTEIRITKPLIFGSSKLSSTQMFNGCISLHGGNGTTYDPSHTDAEYARLDDPDNGKPGYCELVQEILAKKNSLTLIV